MWPLIGARMAARQARTQKFYRRFHLFDGPPLPQNSRATW
jgi:hypothetical protein